MVDVLCVVCHHRAVNYGLTGNSDAAYYARIAADTVVEPFTPTAVRRCPVVCFLASPNASDHVVLRCVLQKVALPSEGSPKDDVPMTGDSAEEAAIVERLPTRASLAGYVVVR